LINIYSCANSFEKNIKSFAAKKIITTTAAGYYDHDK
jgi:hypothetical protein